MTVEDKINLVVNWLNTKGINGTLRLVPTIMGYGLLEWLDDNGVLKDKKDILKVLFERQDLYEAQLKYNEVMYNTCSIMSDCCKEKENNPIPCEEAKPTVPKITVGELIDKLSGFPRDAEVKLHIGENTWRSITHVGEAKTQTFKGEGSWYHLEDNNFIGIE